MIKSEKASLSVTRIAIITIITIFALSVGVLASSTEVKSVTIVLADNCEIEVLTTKTLVSDILEENHIVVLPEESVVPNLDSEITDNTSKIVIIGTTQDASSVVEVAEESDAIAIDQLLSAYTTITEKIETKQEAIAYETITNDNSTSSSNTVQTVTQEGKEGIKEITYKIKYQNDIEIERTVISEEVIEEPVNEIIQISNVTTRSSSSRTTSSSSTKTTTSSNTSSSKLASKVEGITPITKTLNASAYTASTCGKSASSSSYGITSSGAKATAWYTVAAGSAYPIGTIIYIPYFAKQSNGGWFVVQDRGSAISNSKIDIYMNTYTECVSFGRRNLECYIYILD